MSWPHERAYYRIEYPTAARPKLFIAGIAHEVLDLSEQGVRWRRRQEIVPVVGEEIGGTLRFRRGQSVEVRGVVLRLSAVDAAAHLEVGVPFQLIVDEQRYLREHHRGMAW
jgi:hypothetical protein